MPTYSSDVLPNVTGVNLGSASLRWNLFVQNLDISGTITIPNTNQITNLNSSLLLGSTWAAPGTIGSTTPSTGAFTTLTATPVTGATVKVSGALSVNTTAVTANANSTSAQNLQSYSVPASALNTAGKTLRVWCSGVYTTQGGQTPTVTIDIQLGGVTLCTWASQATTASQTNMPWNAEAKFSTVATGASGTLEAHGRLSIKTGSGATGNADTVLDTNSAVSSAIDLTTAETLQVRVTFSTNAAGPNTCASRQLVVELLN